MFAETKDYVLIYLIAGHNVDVATINSTEILKVYVGNDNINNSEILNYTQISQYSDYPELVFGFYGPQWLPSEYSLINDYKYIETSNNGQLTEHTMYETTMITVGGGPDYSIRLGSIYTSESTEIIDANIYFDVLDNGQSAPIASYAGFLAIYDNTLFVFGGVTSSGSNSYVYYTDLDNIISNPNMNDFELDYEYNPNWKSSDWLARPIGSQTCVSIMNELIFVAGDSDSTLYIFNLSSKTSVDTGSYSSTMLGNDGFCAVNNETHVFFSGRAVNYDTYGTLQIYNVYEDSWSYGADMVQARILSACTYDKINNVIWNIGGTGAGSATQVTTIQYYKIDENKWYLLNSELHTARSHIPCLLWPPLSDSNDIGYNAKLTSTVSDINGENFQLIYIFPGYSAAGLQNDIEVLYISNDNINESYVQNDTLKYDNSTEFGGLYDVYSPNGPIWVPLEYNGLNNEHFIENIDGRLYNITLFQTTFLIIGGLKNSEYCDTIRTGTVYYQDSVKSFAFLSLFLTWFYMFVCFFIV